MTNHHVTRSLLQDYLDGTLTPRERDSVGEHLQSCSACADELAQVRRVHLLAASLPKQIEPSHDLWTGIESRIRKPVRTRSIFDLALRRNGTQSAGKEGDTGTGMKRASVVRWSLSAAAVIVTGFIGWSILRPSATGDLPAWQVIPIEGKPLIDSKEIAGRGHIHKGGWLETDGSSRAEIEVGSIGRVAVGPNSRICLLEASDTDHRLSLAQGEIHATVSAPPRLFFVETPSALAVDLGCSYALRVTPDGTGILEVTAGYVALELRGRRAVVPAGMTCLTRPRSGPGTPFLGDAPLPFRKALEEFDFIDAADSTLETVLAGAREEDAITLWHLLFRVDRDRRAMVYDRIAGLLRSPEGTTREGVLAGDPAMISEWQDQVGLGPIVTWEFPQ